MKRMFKKRKLTGTQGVALGLAIALFIYPTPVRSAVQDNLESAVALVVGEKADTTSKDSYNDATICAKLNYMEKQMAALEERMNADRASSIDLLKNSSVGLSAIKSSISAQGQGSKMVVPSTNVLYTASPNLTAKNSTSYFYFTSSVSGEVRVEITYETSTQGTQCGVLAVSDNGLATLGSSSTLTSFGGNTGSPTGTITVSSTIPLIEGKRYAVYAFSASPTSPIAVKTVKFKGTVVTSASPIVGGN